MSGGSARTLKAEWGRGQAGRGKHPGFDASERKYRREGLSKGARMEKEREETGVALAASRRLKKQGGSWPAGI